MKNKEKVLKIILIITIILASIIVILLIIGKDPKEKTNNKDDEGVVKTELTDERIKDLIYYSYIYYILSQGEVPVTEEYMMQGETKYNEVDLGISNFEVINGIIDDMIVESKREYLRSKIFENPNRSFLTVYQRLFINKTAEDKPCIIENVSYENEYTIKNKKDTEAIIAYGNTETYMYLENGKWYLNEPIFYCDAS